MIPLHYGPISLDFNRYVGLNGGVEAEVSLDSFNSIFNFEIFFVEIVRVGGDIFLNFPDVPLNFGDIPGKSHVQVCDLFFERVNVCSE